MYDLGKLKMPEVDPNELRSGSRNADFELWDRPLGITLIALWQFIGSAFSVILGLVTISATSEFSLLGGMGCLLLATVPLDIALGVGLWQMRHWARIATIVLSALWVGLQALSAHVSGFAVVGIVLDTAIVFYLLLPSVRNAFEERPLI